MKRNHNALQFLTSNWSTGDDTTPCLKLNQIVLLVTEINPNFVGLGFITMKSINLSNSLHPGGHLCRPGLTEFAVLKVKSKQFSSLGKPPM